MNQFAYFFAGIIVYLILFFGMQLILFRTRQIKELIFTFSILAFLAGFLTWISFFYLTKAVYPDPVIRGLLAFAGLYGSLGFSGTYIILGPISADRSLSAHICITMLRAGRGMTLDEIFERYGRKYIFQKRFREYTDVEVMTESPPGTYHLTSKGRRVAYTFLAFLKALKMKENF